MGILFEFAMHAVTRGYHSMFTAKQASPAEIWVHLELLRGCSSHRSIGCVEQGRTERALGLIGEGTSAGQTLGFACQVGLFVMAEFAILPLAAALQEVETNGPSSGCLPHLQAQRQKAIKMQTEAPLCRTMHLLALIAIKKACRPTCNSAVARVQSGKRHLLRRLLPSSSFSSTS